MIWESHYWKVPLLQDRKYLSRFRITGRTREDTLVSVEKRLFIAFYAIRKLIEADKLTTAYLSRQFEVLWHPNVSRVDKMNWHKIDEKYDLSMVKREMRDLKWLANQIIHSFVFIPLYRESGLFDGVYVASDRERNKRVYFFSRKLILDTLDLIGNDYPVHSRSTRDENGDWVTEQW